MLLLKEDAVLLGSGYKLMVGLQFVGFLGKFLIQLCAGDGCLAALLCIFLH